jgi:hypothetical protein
VLHGVEMDDGVEGARHGLEFGAKLTKVSAILAPAGRLLLKWRIVDFLGVAAFHGIKQPTPFLELLE